MSSSLSLRCCCPCVCGRDSPLSTYKSSSSSFSPSTATTSAATSSNDIIQMDQIQVNQQNTVTTNTPTNNEVFRVARAAALTGDKESLRVILSSESWLLNAGDEFGRTLLMYACLCDRHKLVKWLIKKGASLSQTDSQGRTALHWSVQKASHRSLSLLASKSSISLSPNQWLSSDEEGINPLHLAVRLYNTKCLQILLHKLASSSSCCSLVDGQQRSPLHWSAACGHPDHLEALLSNSKLQLNIDQTDAQGRTPLMWAVACPTDGGISCVRLLLSWAPWSLSTPDRRGLSAVHVAVIANNERVLQVLIDEYKCSLELLDNNIRSPLHWAARLGHKDIVKILLKHGALMHRDRNGASPLHCAAQNNHKDTVLLILEHFHKQELLLDSDGRSGFMWCIAAGMKETSLAMIEHTEIDTNERDAHGQTALHIAAQMGHTHLVEMLIEKGWSTKTLDLSGQTSLMCACARGHSRVVSLLVRGGADTHTKDLCGRTALHWSCLGGHAFICQLLVKQYALNPNESDNGGRTPLHCGAFAGFIGCVSSLLQAGADASIAENQGLTALHMACSRGHTEVASLLLEWGSPVNALGGDDVTQTPLDLALSQGHAQVTETLLLWNGLDYANLKQLAATMIQAYYKGYKDNDGRPVVVA